MPSLTYARTPQEAVALAADAGTEFKAGGTDVLSRLGQAGPAPAALINLVSIPGLRGITEGPGGLRLGAMTTLRELLQHPAVAERFPVLFQATEHTATPQIRAMATLGGVLCQRPRCVYLRHPDFTCRKRGGAECYARLGDHSTHAIFDNKVCCAPHASTVAAALLALDATLEVRLSGAATTQSMTLADFFDFNLGDATVENALPRGALVEAVLLPGGSAPERQGYVRASARHRADWADVEVAVALWLQGPLVRDARVVLGGVGRTPLRAEAAEKRLVGNPLDAARAAAAAAASTQDATPLPLNGYKIALTRGAVQAALEGVLA